MGGRSMNLKQSRGCPGVLKDKKMGVGKERIAKDSHQKRLHL